MSRAVFVSAGGDPFILLLVHKLFKERWYDEVDRFWVCYNNHSKIPLDVVSEVLGKLVKDPKVNLMYYQRGIGNGMPITQMCHASHEDNVMLLEDDGFIFSNGVVDECFKKIEDGSYDAGGSPRFSCGVEVGEASKKKYNLDYTGYGDVGPNFWPNFFFCKREDLMKTDMNFASKTWEAGERSEELDHTFKEQNHGDTFVWTSVQMRAMGLKFFEVPQNHASPTELADKELKTMNYIGDPMRWIHGGSLSAGMGGYLSGEVPGHETKQQRQEMETRVAFWTIASDVIEGFDDFKKVYKEGIKSLTANAKLNTGRINAKIKLYKELMYV